MNINTPSSATTADALRMLNKVPAVTLAFWVIKVMATTFATWYASVRTLSIHTVVTRRRESFYWLAILFTFALDPMVAMTASQKRSGASRSGARSRACPDRAAALSFR